MRVIRDGVGDITRDGETLHANVRYQADDQGRVAVWTSRQGAPAFVYEPHSVLYELKRKPCSCKGDTPKMTLTRAWTSFDNMATA